MRVKSTDLWFARRLPGRLTRAEAGALLGFTEDDMVHLIAEELLQPLCGYSQGTPSWFASVDIETCCKDRKWLARATRAVRDANRRKNANQRASRLRAAARESGDPAAAVKAVAAGPL